MILVMVEQGETLGKVVMDVEGAYSFDVALSELGPTEELFLSTAT